MILIFQADQGDIYVQVKAGQANASSRYERPLHPSIHQFHIVHKNIFRAGVVTKGYQLRRSHAINSGFWESSPSGLISSSGPSSLATNLRSLTWLPEFGVQTLSPRLPRWPSACLYGHVRFIHGLNLQAVSRWVNLQPSVLQSAPFLQSGMLGCLKWQCGFVQ